MDPLTPLCYCGGTEKELAMLTCRGCQKEFHQGCLRNGRPTPLLGDMFFAFVCANCSKTGSEKCNRVKLQWLQVVMLALYNLHRTSTGKQGYFRWKEHVCAFIERNWTTIFGHARKKTSTWYGTVAGALSAGGSEYFKSGTAELKEHGWWALKTIQPPNFKTVSASKLARRSKSPATLSATKDTALRVDGLRNRRQKTSIEAAMELKAKRDASFEVKKKRKSKSSPHSVFRSPPSASSSQNESMQSFLSSSFSPVETFSYHGDNMDMDDESSYLDDSTSSSKLSRSISWVDDIVDENSQFSIGSSKSDQYLTEKDLRAEENVPDHLLKDDDEDDLKVDANLDSIFDLHENLTGKDSLPNITDILNAMDGSSSPSLQNAFSKNASLSFPADFSAAEIKTEPLEEVAMEAVDEDDVATEPRSDNGSEIESEADAPLSDKEELTDIKQERDDLENRPRRLRRGESSGLYQRKERKPKFVPMSVAEEKQALIDLNSLGNISDARFCRLRRKLLVRQRKRELGKPVFNYDDLVNKLCGHRPAEFVPPRDAQLPVLEGRVLDRFQNPLAVSSAASALAHKSFSCRLIGQDDDQLESIISPYTARSLKPFIRRDWECEPLKLKLLREIVSKGQTRNGTAAAPVQTYPVDYCYLHPQHLSSVNQLAQEFFWPGIDVSSCLKYPDFTCVVLYRKLVVGFSFMVPDVSYNEAYISFIWTHPEWRCAGIGRFMLYHLIQTCLGKDITLHVSPTNPAMLLYQKFGFKPEEFIVDFYDRYLPAASTECRHAMYMRLRR